MDAEKRPVVLEPTENGFIVRSERRYRETVAMGKGVFVFNDYEEMFQHIINVFGPLVEIKEPVPPPPEDVSETNVSKASRPPMGEPAITVDAPNGGTTMSESYALLCGFKKTPDGLGLIKI
jgi:hypothetical protein